MQSTQHPTTTPEGSDLKQRTFWEKVAESRWGRYITEVEANVLEKARASFAAPGVALEVGCEGGRWSRFLAEHGWSTICTDINEKVLNLCKARIPGANCILVKEGDTKLPVGNHSVDLVLCVEVIAVLRNSWFMEETARVLRKNGMLMGVFNNKCSLRGFPHHVGNVLTSRFDWYALSYAPWRKELRAHGFDLVHEEGICWFPFRRSSDSRFVTPAVVLERLLGFRKLPKISPWIVFLSKKTG